MAKMPYKFVQRDVPMTLQDALNYQAEQLTRATGSGNNYIRLGGWHIPLERKAYLVEYHYGGIGRVWSNNVKNLRADLNLSRRDRVVICPFTKPE